MPAQSSLFGNLTGNAFDFTAFSSGSPDFVDNYGNNNEYNKFKHNIIHLSLIQFLCYFFQSFFVIFIPMLLKSNIQIRSNCFIDKFIHCHSAQT